MKGEHSNAWMIGLSADISSDPTFCLFWHRACKYYRNNQLCHLHLLYLHLACVSFAETAATVLLCVPLLTNVPDRADLL